MNGPSLFDDVTEDVQYVEHEPEPSDACASCGEYVVDCVCGNDPLEFDPDEEREDEYIQSVDVDPTLASWAEPPPDSIEARFALFHEANPWVYAELVRLTRELVRRGRCRVGIKMLFEVLRWQYQMRTDDPTSDFKLNNSLTSRYARRIMEHEPDLAGIYETRQLKAP